MSEDCHYCSQSAIPTASINKYRLLSADQLLAGAHKAAESGARRYCMVTSGRGPSDKDIEHLSEAVRAIKQKFPSLEICPSLGLMSEAQARRLKEAGGLGQPQPQHQPAIPPGNLHDPYL